MAIYLVNYRISNDFSVYVEALNAEDAQHVVETIYQNNFDILPEDGELDHDIDKGIYIAKPSGLEDDDIYRIEDAFPNGKPPYYED